jgi:multidrug resistance efflux pump
MSRQTILSLGVAIAVGAGCATLREEWTGRPTVDPALVAHLDESEMGAIRKARSKADEARDELAKAEAMAETAEERLDIARDELEPADQRVEIAKRKLDNARDHGTAEELEQAEEELGRARDEHRSARRKVALREKELEHARAQTDLAQARVDLALAETELVQAEAVADLDRPAAREIDLDAFRRAVREAKRELEIAQVRLEAAEEEVAIARDDYESARAGDEGRPREASSRREENEF